MSAILLFLPYATFVIYEFNVRVRFGEQVRLMNCQCVQSVMNLDEASIVFS